jgi:cysteine desulfurase
MVTPTIMLPGIVNLGFAGVDGESLLLSLRQLALSSGSACMSATLEPSYVLRGIGVSDEIGQSSLRLSFGRFSTEQDIDTAVEALIQHVERLREASAGEIHAVCPDLAHCVVELPGHKQV